MKAIVIENSHVFRRIFSDMYSKLGYTVSLANNIREANLLLNDQKFDLICAANELSDGSGYDLAKHCREKQIVTAATPIFLVTSAQIDSGLLSKALGCGVTEIFSKINIEKVQEQLEHFARRQITNEVSTGQILYIEDSIAIAKATMKLLETVCDNIFHFTSTEHAFSILHEHDIDLILSDIVVEGKESVLSMVQRIRADKSLIAHIPIMLITGFDDIARRIEFYRNGINDYIIKPALDTELVIRVRNLILQHQLMMKVVKQSNTLNWLNTHDELTNCYRRDYLYSYFPQYLREAQLKNANVGFIGFSIDHFNAIKNKVGTLAADKLLEQISKKILQNVKSGDFISRINNEDFLIVTSACDKESLLKYADKLRLIVMQTSYADCQVSATFSVNVLDPSKTDNFENLLNTLLKHINQTRSELGQNIVSSLE